MNSKLKIVLVGAACLAVCAMTRAQSPAVMAPQASPMGTADNSMMGPPPSHDYVWMSGHWNSEGGQWKWVAGHWDLPPNRSAVWVAGHWIQGGSGWAWMNGAWNVAEAPQSPGSPPTPPGENAAMVNTQGAPMPSTPAPNMQGQYYDGQVPAAYQGATVSDYGPIDYSVSSPGYYWTGDAWAWGIYPGPFYFGLGFGPRYFGGGYFGGGRGFARFGRGGFAHGFGHVGGGHFR
jgi:hypothetical protein